MYLKYFSNVLVIILNEYKFITIHYNYIIFRINKKIILRKILFFLLILGIYNILLILK